MPSAPALEKVLPHESAVRTLLRCRHVVESLNRLLETSFWLSLYDELNQKWVTLSEHLRPSVLVIGAILFVLAIFFLVFFVGRAIPLRVAAR
jgi:hypothetical protein